MNILEIKHLEDCLDGSVVKELLLSKEISAEFIKSLGKEGNLQYFPHFARPFFKLRIDGKLNLKAIEGNTSLRFLLESSSEENSTLLTLLINNF